MNDLALIPVLADLIPHGDGYIYKMADQYHPRLVVKIPQPVYQICYDAAQLPFGLENRQQRILKILQDWAIDKYPKYGIVGFLDMDLKEAEMLTDKVGFPFTWGIYLVLEYGAETKRVTNTSQNKIDNHGSSKSLD